MKHRISLLALNIAVAGVVAPAALGQTAPDSQFVRNRYIAVTDRPQPDFDPQALNLGGFSLNSSLGLAARANDNIFAQSTNSQSDTIFEATPQAQLVSNWAVHEFDAGFTYDSRTFADNDSENASDYNLYAHGRIDVTSDFAFGAQGNRARITEGRYEPSSPGTASKPVHYDRTGGEVFADFVRDRIQFDGRVGITDDDFDDVGAVAIPPAPAQVIDQDFRDVRDTYGLARGSFAVSRSIAVFLQGRTDTLKYRHDPGPFNRDADRNTIQAGLNFELDAPFRGDIAVGYTDENKKNASLQDSSGLSVDAHLQWFPTEITTVTFTGSRQVFDPGLPNSATAFYDIFGVHIDHELTRQIVLFGDLSGGDRDYQDINRKDKLFNAGAGVAYKMNRHARLEAGYTYMKQDTSGGAVGDFNQNVFSVGIRIYP